MITVIYKLGDFIMNKRIYIFLALILLTSFKSNASSIPSRPGIPDLPSGMYIGPSLPAPLPGSYHGTVGEYRYCVGVDPRAVPKILKAVFIGDTYTIRDLMRADIDKMHIRKVNYTKTSGICCKYGSYDFIFCYLGTSKFDSSVLASRGPVIDVRNTESISKTRALTIIDEASGYGKAYMVKYRTSVPFIVFNTTKNRKFRLEYGITTFLAIPWGLARILKEIEYSQGSFVVNYAGG